MTAEISLTRINYRNLWLGALAGLAGGIPFGIMMAMMGMMPMIGMLIRIENAVVGFIVHMVISAIVGALYGHFAPALPRTWRAATIAGVIYGVIWWVLGALTLMPLFLGMLEMMFVIGGPQWMSLAGHIIYTTITAWVFFWLYNRQ